MKELKIEVPDGYEIDIEKSNLKICKVCFRKVEQINQHEFDEFFKSLLHGANRLVFYNNDYTISILPTNHFTLYDGNGQWLFDIRIGENAHFYYSHHIILPLFKEKFGINEMMLNNLMLHMIEQLFGLKGVIPSSSMLMPHWIWNSYLD